MFENCIDQRNCIDHRMSRLWRRIPFTTDTRMLQLHLMKRTACDMRQHESTPQHSPLCKTRWTEMKDDPHVLNRWIRPLIEASQFCPIGRGKQGALRNCKPSCEDVKKCR